MLKTKSPRLGYLLHDLFLDCHAQSTLRSARSCRDSIMSSLDGIVINTLVTLGTDFLGLRRQWRSNTRVPCFQSWLEAARLPEEMRLSSLPLIRPPAEEAPSLGTGKPVTDRHHQLSGCLGLLKCVVQAHLCLERGALC